MLWEQCSNCSTAHFLSLQTILFEKIIICLHFVDNETTNARYPTKKHSSFLLFFDFHKFGYLATLKWTSACPVLLSVSMKYGVTFFNGYLAEFVYH